MPDRTSRVSLNPSRTYTDVPTEVTVSSADALDKITGAGTVPVRVKSVTDRALTLDLGGAEMTVSFDSLDFDRARVGAEATLSAVDVQVRDGAVVGGSIDISFG